MDDIRNKRAAYGMMLIALVGAVIFYFVTRIDHTQKAREFFSQLVKEEQDIAALKEWDRISPMVRKYYADDAIVTGIVSTTGAQAPDVNLQNTSVTRDEYIALFEKNMKSMDGYNFEIEPPAIYITPTLRFAALSYDLKEKGILRDIRGPRGFPLQLTSTGRCAMLLDMKTMLIRKAQCGLMADVQEKPATEIVGHTVQ